jgi:hypothetical protein
MDHIILIIFKNQKIGILDQNQSTFDISKKIGYGMIGMCMSNLGAVLKMTSRASQISSPRKLTINWNYSICKPLTDGLITLAKPTNLTS